MSERDYLVNKALRLKRPGVLQLAKRPPKVSRAAQEQAHQANLQALLNQRSWGAGARMAEEQGVWKSLPSALRNIPKGETMNNKYIASRVMAHDRGRDAAHLIARNNRTENRIATMYPKRKRHLLTGQMRGLTDPLERFYQGQGLRESRGRTEGVRRQGIRWREASRGQLARTPSRNLIEQQKYVRAA